MAETMRKGERRVSAPLVLAAASGMLAIAAVIFLSSHGGSFEATAREKPDANAFRVDDSTPERVAESFYDAWRRRRWTQALEISVGEARDAVIAKRSRDEAMPRAERIVAERTWDALAHAPLRLRLDEAEMLGDEQYRLHGTAEYLFLGQPYRRRVQFLITPAGEHFRVAQMELGEVLTELPELFQGTDPEAR